MTEQTHSQCGPSHCYNSYSELWLDDWKHASITNLQAQLPPRSCNLYLAGRTGLPKNQQIINSIIKTFWLLYSVSGSQLSESTGYYNFIAGRYFLSNIAQIEVSCVFVVDCFQPEFWEHLGEDSECGNHSK